MLYVVRCHTTRSCSAFCMVSGSISNAMISWLSWQFSPFKSILWCGWPYRSSSCFRHSCPRSAMEHIIQGHVWIRWLQHVVNPDLLSQATYPIRARSRCRFSREAAAEWEQQWSRQHWQPLSNRCIVNRGWYRVIGWQSKRTQLVVAGAQLSHMLRGMCFSTILHRHRSYYWQLGIHVSYHSTQLGHSSYGTRHVRVLGWYLCRTLVPWIRHIKIWRKAYGVRLSYYHRCHADLTMVDPLHWSKCNRWVIMLIVGEDNKLINDPW